MNGSSTRLTNLPHPGIYVLGQLMRKVSALTCAMGHVTSQIVNCEPWELAPTWQSPHLYSFLPCYVSGFCWWELGGQELCWGHHLSWVAKLTKPSTQPPQPLMLDATPVAIVPIYPGLGPSVQCSAGFGPVTFGSLVAWLNMVILIIFNFQQITYKLEWIQILTGKTLNYKKLSWC